MQVVWTMECQEVSVNLRNDRTQANIAKYKEQRYHSHVHRYVCAVSGEQTTKLELLSGTHILIFEQ